MRSPIIKKDLKVLSRSMKFSWGIFAYEMLLAIVFFLTLSVFNTTSSYMGGPSSNRNLYETYVYFFPIIGIAQLCMIALVVPVITASAISGEREHKTMDVLLTTAITPPQIVMGKIGTAIIRVMVFVIASVPLMAISFTVGGMSWLQLLLYIVMAFFLGFLTGSVGVMCSSLCKKSISAIILSYIIYLGLYGLPFVGFLIEYLIHPYSSTYYITPFILLIDPIVSFIAYYVQLLSDERQLDIFDNSIKFYEILTNVYVWITVSLVVQTGLAILFSWIASRRLKKSTE